MRWEAPHLFWLLWLLPAVGGLVWMSRQRQQRAAAEFADCALWTRLLPPSATAFVQLKIAALALGLVCIIAGAARPRWGVYFEEVRSRGVDLFILLDVSRSMLAEDVAPSRLERAKSDIRDLLEKLAGNRVGLIAFAGAATVQVPLTTDHHFFFQILDDIDPSSAPRGGSLIGDAIRKGLASMERRHDRDQVLVVITDGEDHDSFPEEAARQAAERGVKIFTVGLGDPAEGKRIPIRNEQGELVYLQHDGQQIWSRMDEELLKKIALETNGAYIPAQTRDYDLGEIYQQHLAELTRGELSAEKRKRYRERFQIFLALGIGLLLLEMILPRYAPSNEPLDVTGAVT